jgi:hypothetical protein
MKEHAVLLVALFYIFAALLIIARIVNYATFSMAELTDSIGYLTGDMMQNISWFAMVNIGFFQSASMI